MRPRFNTGTAWVVVNNYRKGDYRPYLFRTRDYGETWQNMVDENQVKGYALSVVQDIQEPSLVFLGTENGLWISIDEGNNWIQFKNGFPSVSTMDLKIQESESALVVGTFGRAIWVLDDLNALRAAAKGELTEALTALPVNEVVQVKGLFIAPPGNIWTGFHTTFEGKNRVFQKVKIPFYLQDATEPSATVTADIYDESGALINTLVQEPASHGLNYLVWKLDEHASNLPGAWIHEESRGVPVLPGQYKVVLQWKTFKDSTSVKVIPDPRFDLAPEIDEALHAYQKQVDEQVATLAALLLSIDQKTDALAKLEKQLKALGDTAGTEILQKVMGMAEKLETLKANGQTPRPKRQVGAWQTSAVTPYSKVNDVQRIAMSRVRPISQQERERLNEATQMVKAFEEQVSQFLENDWKPFVKQIRQADIDWLVILE